MKSRRIHMSLKHGSPGHLAEQPGLLVLSGTDDKIVLGWATPYPF
jgi:hypothetical protein